MYLGVDTDSISTTSKTTTTTSTSVKTTKEVEKAITAPPAQTAAVRSPSTFKIDAHTAKWLNYKIDKPAGKTNKSHLKTSKKKANIQNWNRYLIKVEDN